MKFSLRESEIFVLRTKVKDIPDAIQPGMVFVVVTLFRVCDFSYYVELVPLHYILYAMFRPSYVGCMLNAIVEKTSILRMQ